MPVTKEQRPPDPERSSTASVIRELEFPAEPASARHARHLIAEVCSEQGLDSLLEPATLCTAEVVTNAIRYGHAGAVRVRVLRLGSALRVEVDDDNAALPALHPPSPHDVSGRGLMIVSAVAQDWGSGRNAHGGKTVWFSVDADTDYARAS